MPEILLQIRQQLLTFILPRQSQHTGGAEAESGRLPDNQGGYFKDAVGQSAGQQITERLLLNHHHGYQPQQPAVQHQRHHRHYQKKRTENKADQYSNGILEKYEEKNGSLRQRRQEISKTPQIGNVTRQ